MKNYIKGNYRKSIYTSDKGYVIGLFKIRETNMDSMKDFVNKVVTFTGYFHELNEDDTYFFYGEESVHPRYGFQFVVSEYERITPRDKDGVSLFLASDLFPGIGDKMANNIVELLGENAIDKIIKDRSCLDAIPKLSIKKADKIYNILTKYEESHNLVTSLVELGFSMKNALSIYNYFKNETSHVLEENIYDFIEVDDISFTKIDEIALNQNIKEDDERRIKALIIYLMQTSCYKNGDTFILYEELIHMINNYTAVSLLNNKIYEYLEKLQKEGKIIIEDKKYYLYSLYCDENIVSDNIIYLSNKKVDTNKKIDTYINQLEKNNDITYNSKQKEAIKKSILNNIVIITGGPGTGKTTIVKAITELYSHINNLDYDETTEKIALLAPTGRASKRLAEKTLLPASTIHRFLKWNKESNIFGINENNKDSHELIIIDEVSMVDISLFASLFNGLARDIKLVLVGDYNQLPSVGPGQVLKDLIDSDIVDTIHLDVLYRQDENSYIPYLAEEIKNDNLSDNFMDTRSDYTFLSCSNYNLKESIKNVCRQIVSKGYNYKEVQVMAPMYHGENGIDNLNIELQDIFNPKDPEKRELKYGDIIFRENDKILQLVNNPDDNVYNGDVGTIKYIIYSDTSKSGKNELHIDFDGNIVKYTPKDFANIKHGFIISIHKSQGSEFNIVVIPITKSYSKMLYRKLIYTGITRAKEKLIIIGDAEAFVYSIHNNNEYKRNCSLLEKIRKRLYNK